MRSASERRYRVAGASSLRRIRYQETVLRTVLGLSKVLEMFVLRTQRINHRRRLSLVKAKSVQVEPCGEGTPYLSAATT